MTLVREYQPTFVLGDGETKEFSYLFEEVSENFIKVIVKHSDDSTYTPVFSVDLDSHKVVFGESETAPLDTDLVCIYRETPDLQDTPFRTLQGYDAKALENILSKIVAMIQELKANGFSTQILQGTPWQLDLLHPDDNGASVVVDYNARILKKGLYFQIVSGNLQVSADGNNFIKMPKSADITEFRQKEVITEDLVEYVLQYRVNGVWYNAGGVGGSGLPDQTGNAGKFLTTNGTNASWGTTLTETLYLTGNNTQNKIVFNDGNNDSQKTTLRATWNSILFEHGNDGLFKQAFAFSWLWKAIYPVNWRSSDVVTLGISNYKWSNVYTNKLNNGADIEVPNQAGTMVVANSTGATQGQVLTLDSNLKPAWADASGGLPSTTGATQGQVLALDSNLEPQWATQSVDPHRVIEFQAPTAENNYTWYRKYADGWVEQGGQTSTGGTQTLPITMADTNYNVMRTNGNGRSATTANELYTSVGARTTTTIYLVLESSIAPVFWQVSGMAAS